jgi:hypothetical protein
MMNLHKTLAVLALWFVSTLVLSAGIGPFFTQQPPYDSSNIIPNGPILAPLGSATNPSYSFPQTNLGMYSPGANLVGFSAGGAYRMVINGGATNAVAMRSTTTFGWTPSSDPTATPDTLLARDGANTLAQRNGTAPQVNRVYNTFTDANNGEWFDESWNVVSNVVTLAARANGSGTVRRIDIVGTKTNDSPCAGCVGEVISAVVAAGTVNLATGSSANVTSVSLTAGDWDCAGAINYTYAASTSVTNLTGGASATSAVLPVQDSRFDQETAAQVPTGGAIGGFPIPVTQQLLSTTTTVFLVTQGTFTLNTVIAGGTLRCRRMR